MTLNRDAARALFDNAEPMPTAGGAPFAAASPFAAAAPFDDSHNDTYTPAASRPARKAADWRLIAPIGVAAVCAVAVLVVAQTRDTAEPGRTVAASEIVPPTPMPQATPLAPAPVETAALAPPATRPAPVVASRVRTEPARRAPAPRTVAAAPSASDASSDASTRVPYVPPPALGAPAVVTIAPPAPPPAPAPTPEPQPVTPPQ